MLCLYSVSIILFYHKQFVDQITPRKQENDLCHVFLILPQLLVFFFWFLFFLMDSGMIHLLQIQRGLFLKIQQLVSPSFLFKKWNMSDFHFCPRTNFNNCFGSCDTPRDITGLKIFFSNILKNYRSIERSQKTGHF